jgi:hypothetical protein
MSGRPLRTLGLVMQLAGIVGASEALRLVAQQVSFAVGYSESLSWPLAAITAVLLARSVAQVAAGVAVVRGGPRARTWLRGYLVASVGLAALMVAAMGADDDLPPSLLFAGALQELVWPLAIWRATRAKAPSEPSVDAERISAAEIGGLLVAAGLAMLMVVSIHLNRLAGLAGASATSPLDLLGAAAMVLGQAAPSVLAIWAGVLTMRVGFEQRAARVTRAFLIAAVACPALLTSASLASIVWASTPFPLVRMVPSMVASLAGDVALPIAVWMFLRRAVREPSEPPEERKNGASFAVGWTLLGLGVLRLAAAPAIVAALPGSSPLDLLAGGLLVAGALLSLAVGWTLVRRREAPALIALLAAALLLGGLAVNLLWLPEPMWRRAAGQELTALCLQVTGCVVAAWLSRTRPAVPRARVLHRSSTA